MKVSDELIYSDLADAVLALAKFHLSGGHKGDGSDETCQKALSASALISVMTVNYDVRHQAGIREGIELAAKVAEGHQYGADRAYLNTCKLREEHRNDIATAIRAMAGEIERWL